MPTIPTTKGHCLFYPSGCLTNPDHLKSYYEIDEFIFVHAGLLAGKPLHEQELEDLLWIRAEFIESPYDWNKTIVFGHTPQKVPLLSTHRIGLDTGAGYGKSLTACDVLTRTIWSA